jgi:glycosyltransferase involved in cell wall biosynthesis
VGHKICIIAGQLVVGGSERQLHLWLSNMDRKVYDPLVLTLHPGQGDFWEEPIESLGVPLIRIEHRQNPLLRLQEIVKALRPYQPQLIHGWHLFASSYAGAAAAMLGSKSLGSLRSSFSAFQSSPAQSISTRWLVDAILANSHLAAEKLANLSWRKRASVYWVPNGLEGRSADRQKVRAELSRLYGIPMEKILIGGMGRLFPKKNFDGLLKAFAGMHEEIPASHLVIVGDGPERASLEKLAKDLAVSEHVTFTGEVPQAQDWLSGLDIFCFTSVDEGLPNAVMEAAAAGLPITAWDLPFNREIIENGKSALLAAPRDLQGLRIMLVRLCGSSVLREALGAAAREEVLAKFTVERFVDGMNRVYADLLGRPKDERQVGDDIRIS